MAVPFDTPGFLDAVIALLEDIPDMGEVHVGAPNVVGPRVTVYVTLAWQDLVQRVANGPHGGVWDRWCWALVVFCYRITEAGPVAAAEAQLAAYVDALIAGLYDNDNRTLGGVVSDTQLDLTMGRQPEYQIRAGVEFREYPVLIGGRQQQQFGE